MPTAGPFRRGLSAELRSAAVLTLLASELLERVRAAVDGPLMLIKGLEVASLYPEPSLRPFADVDLLAAHPDAAYQALLAAGCVPIGHRDSYYEDRHHLRPLQWPGLPFAIEIHRRPEWPKWSEPPSSADLFSSTVPSATGVDGLLGLAPPAHAVVLAAHSWSGAPLRRLLDLIDVMVLAGSVREEAESLAARWDLLRVWRTTTAAAEALFLGRKAPWSLRIWARDLPEVRDRSVLGNHLRPLTGAFWGLSFHRALRVAGGELFSHSRPEPGEEWSAKLARTKGAFRHAFDNLSEHQLSLSENGARLDPEERGFGGTASPTH